MMLFVSLFILADCRAGGRKKIQSDDVHYL